MESAKTSRDAEVTPATEPASVSSSARGATPSPKPLRKKARIEEVPAKVTVFHSDNPANVSGRDPVDYRPIEKAETKQVIVERMKRSQLNPVDARGTKQQAFSVFAIPVILDTEQLSCQELRAELKVRGLALSGTKDILRQRLDRHIMANEKERAKQHSGRKSGELFAAKGGVLAKTTAKKTKK